MNDNCAATPALEPPAARRRMLRSPQQCALHSEPDDAELAANAPELTTPRTPHPNPHTPAESSSACRTSANSRHPYPYFGMPASETSSAATDLSSVLSSTSSQGRGSRRSFSLRGHRRAASNSTATSPRTESAPRPAHDAIIDCSNLPSIPLRLDDDDDDDDDDDGHLPAAYGHRIDQAAFDQGPWAAAPDTNSASSSGRHRVLPLLDPFEDDDDDYADLNGRVARMSSQIGQASRSSVDDLGQVDQPVRVFGARAAAALKRQRERLEFTESQDVPRMLSTKGAVAAILYRNGVPDLEAIDVWPDFRNSTKLPARYHLLRNDNSPPCDAPSKRRSIKVSETKVDSHHDDLPNDPLPDAPIGRPVWSLPVELVEQIARHLNRDDIKSMRLVSRELNRFVSQVIFKTVVVPFNTEIYGMLGKDQKPDAKGQRRVKVENSAFIWKNTNTDDVYKGHGLDVFRGFGQHILRYGMSFEVNEDSLAKPPDKSLTKRHTSFWGSYDWPFEEYRRFDDVAGLESAADETPRMKIAFSELCRVKELALSVDSGLGWLNGPDRSIRARILQRPPDVFGTLKKIPDRRAQAQMELWNHLESRHQDADSDIKLATLFRMEMSRLMADAQDSSILLEDQPALPFLDPHVIHEAIPQDTTEVQVPTSFDDPDVLERFIMVPSSSAAGILFTSAHQPTDASRLMSGIIPANLTKTQKEWLMETEWAQRAFLSSYMLSVIDNPSTFHPVHTLNLARLSDRYIPMLNRLDFWNALPHLKHVVLMVIPGWRTVHKDEAGFVDTPRINPSSGIDPFYELLRDIVSQLPNVKTLAFGWSSGGEHAEGIHARNRLLLPAPLLIADHALEQDPTLIAQQILQFPHVRELRLKNCWLTPPLLLQLVKKHDSLCLKHLILDSVSLTAILSPHANGQNHHPPVGNAVPANLMAGLLGAMFNAHNNLNAVAAPMPNLVQIPPAQPGAQVMLQGMHANQLNPGQFLHFHIQALQLQIQQLQAQGGGAYQPQIAALQAQLANQIQLQNQQQAQNQANNQNQGQGQNNVQLIQHNLALLFAQVQQIQHQQAAAILPPAAPINPPINTQTVLRAQPRGGSWTNIIDIISPGTNLSDFGSEFSQAVPERTTSLERVSFTSCGYVKLPHTTFDQTAIEPLHSLTHRHPFLIKRFTTLAPAMLSTKWALLGEIVQEIDMTELATLNAGWEMETGWHDAEAARAVEFDGLLPGGTGRFTGKLRREDRVAQASTN